MLSGKDPPTTIVISANAAKLAADSKKKGFKVDLTTDMPQQGRNLACPKKLHLLHFIALYMIGDTQQGVPGQFIRFNSELKGKATWPFITFPLELDESVFLRLDKFSNLF